MKARRQKIKGLPIEKKQGRGRPRKRAKNSIIHKM